MRVGDYADGLAHEPRLKEGRYRSREYYRRGEGHEPRSLSKKAQYAA
jgi:hypothetical protein